MVFGVLFASHLLAALYSPIQDCDEVFNYWEPTHYLNHGHGFQTWEYSPEYAIRSWAYAGLHALLTPLGRLASFAGISKPGEFYVLRSLLGLACALCETRLVSKLATALNARIAVLYLLITATSPGMFHASVAYLPSSFAMYFTMLGMAAFMDWRGGLRTAQGIFCMATGACLGWPFAAAMAVPFLMEELLLASVSDFQGMRDLFLRIFDGCARSLALLAIQVSIDWFFYKRLLIVPLNIIWYNVLSNKGPDLYGTEPWHFYLRNLFLNFHVWLLLALLSLPLLLGQYFFVKQTRTRSSYLRGTVFLTPFYLWLAIFTLQPHKEERFMYPAYPALILNASVAMHIILASLGSTDSRHLTSKIPVQLRFAGILAFLLGACALFAIRTIGVMTAFSAPLSIYQPLHGPGAARPGDNVCLGKEWYRFPSHYLLPEGVHAKFVRSEFTGLLPGEFSTAQQGLGIFPGTWLVPPGMNDENRDDPGKYTDIKRCNFLVDSFLPSTEPTKLEPDYIKGEQTWDKVKCVPFLDSSSTGVIGRLGWIPDLPFVPAKYKRVWGEYCLLKRIKKPADSRMMPPNVETLA